MFFQGIKIINLNGRLLLGSPFIGSMPDSFPTGGIPKADRAKNAEASLEMSSSLCIGCVWAEVCFLHG